MTTALPPGAAELEVEGLRALYGPATLTGIADARKGQNPALDAILAGQDPEQAAVLPEVALIRAAAAAQEGRIGPGSHLAATLYELADWVEAGGPDAPLPGVSDL